MGLENTKCGEKLFLWLQSGPGSMHWAGTKSWLTDLSRDHILAQQPLENMIFVSFLQVARKKFITQTCYNSH